MAKKNKTQKQRNLILFLLLIVIVLFSFVYIEFFNKPTYISTINTKFTIGEKTGMFSENSDELNFGKIIQGSSISRKISIDNNNDFDLKAKIFSSTSIAKYLSFSPEILIPAKTTVDIPFNLITKKDTPLGNYSGKILIEYWKI